MRQLYRPKRSLKSRELDLPRLGMRQPRSQLLQQQMLGPDDLCEQQRRPRLRQKLPWPHNPPSLSPWRPRQQPCKSHHLNQWSRPQLQEARHARLQRSMKPRHGNMTPKRFRSPPVTASHRATSLPPVQKNHLHLHLHLHQHQPPREKLERRPPCKKVMPMNPTTRSAVRRPPCDEVGHQPSLQ